MMLCYESDIEAVSKQRVVTKSLCNKWMCKNLAVADGSAVVASDSSGLKNSMRTAATSRAAWPCGLPLQCSHWVLSRKYFSVFLNPVHAAITRRSCLCALARFIENAFSKPWTPGMKLSWVLALGMICLLHGRRERLCLCQNEQGRVSALDLLRIQRLKKAFAACKAFFSFLCFWADSAQIVLNASGPLGFAQNLRLRLQR